LRDEVDAGVLPVLAVGLGPVGEGPDLGVEVLVAGLVAKVGEDQVLEVGPLFPFGDGGGAEAAEQVGECGHPGKVAPGSDSLNEGARSEGKERGSRGRGGGS
jgi:hypothetical protein